MIVKTLPSGWIQIRINQQIWAQVPPGYNWKAGVEKKYCFEPEWSWKRINKEIYERAP